MEPQTFATYVCLPIVLAGVSMIIFPPDEPETTARRWAKIKHASTWLIMLVFCLGALAVMALALAAYLSQPTAQLP